MKVINPSGRAVDVPDGHACIEKAKAGEDGWSLPKPPKKPEPPKKAAPTPRLRK